MVYKLFISHAWDYHDEYDRLVEMLNQAKEENKLEWMNYSVPFHDPIDSDNAYEIKNKIREKIRQCSVFIVLAGMWVKYSDWIQFEIDVAKNFYKPILGIKPWGSQKTPEEVKDSSDKIVGWNTDSIVAAIKELAND